MSDEAQRPTAPYNRGYVPRFGMYAGPNYAGGHALRAGELPDAAVWRVPPVGYLDDVTRNHDINYTYIEQTYTGQRRGQPDRKNPGPVAGRQRDAGGHVAPPARQLAGGAIPQRRDTGLCGQGRHELPAGGRRGGRLEPRAGRYRPQFPALQANEQGRARWNLPGLVHAGATYTSTGMEALSTSGVNSQVAVLFNTHIQPGNIAPQKVNTHGELYDPLSRARLQPAFDDSAARPQRPERVHCARRHSWQRSEHVSTTRLRAQLVRTVSSNGQIESQTTYNGVQGVWPCR